MASVNRIDSIYDVAKITAEQEAVAKLVRDSIAQIQAARTQSISFNVDTKSLADYNKNVATLNTSLQSMQKSVANATAVTTANVQATQQANGTLAQNIELRRRLQNTLADNIKNQKEDITLLKTGVLNRAEYNKRLTESQAKTAVYKQKIQELNRVIKEDIAVEGKAGDAYKQLSAEYNRAALAAKNYQITLGKSNPITIDAIARAKGLSNQLKEIDANVGQSGRNVGNYTEGVVGAFKKMFGFLRTAANIIPGAGISGIILGIGTGIAALATWLANLGNASGDAARNLKILNEVREESVKSSAKELTSLDGLISAARNENATREDRNKAVKILQEQYPEYLKNISLETINSEEAQKAIDKLKDSILQKAIADAYADKIAASVIKNSEIKAKLDKQELLDLNNRIAFRNKFNNAVIEGDNATISAMKRYGLANDNIEKTLHSLNAELNESNSELDFLKEGYDKAVLASLALTKVQKQAKEKKEPKGRDLAEANRKAQFEILKAQIELDKEFDLIRAADNKKSFEDRLQNLIIYGADSRRLIEVQAGFDLKKADLTAKERLKIENDKNNALIRLSQELADRLSKITADSFKVDTSKLAEGIKGIPKELQKILDDSDKAIEKAREKRKKALEDLKKDTKDAIVNLASEFEGLFFDIFINALERQKNAIQDQIDLLELQKQKDIEVANQTITNAQDRADAIAVIEARAAAKRQQLELKQRQLDQQKARFEKARTVAEIIQSTSLAVVNALTQVKTLGPGAIALAAVIGAIGAIQIARALAQPIPRYAEGTSNHPGGPMIVGDGGKSEGIILPDGSVYKSPATDTLMTAPSGTQVIPDYATMTKAPVFNIDTVDTTAELRKGFGQVVKAVKNIPQPVIHAEKAWVQAHKQGSNFRNYLNRSI